MSIWNGAMVLCRKTWIALSKLWEWFCPKHWSRIWSVRWTGSLMWYQPVTSLSWSRGSWLSGRSIWFTSQSKFQPSPMVTSFGYWPKEWDHGQKMAKRASPVGWLGSTLEIGWGICEQRASWCGWCIWLGCLLEIFWANWEGTLGQTQNLLEALHILSDLQDKLKTSLERGEGSLEYPIEYLYSPISIMYLHCTTMLQILKVKV